MEEDPNDIKEERDRLMKDISWFESMHSNEKEEWKDTMDKVIKEKQGWIQGSLPDFRNSLKFFPT